MLLQSKVEIARERIEISVPRRKHSELRAQMRKCRQLAAESVELLGRIEEILKKSPLKP